MRNSKDEHPEIKVKGSRTGAQLEEFFNESLKDIIGRRSS